MVELDELEKQHAEFDKRKVRIVAVSNDPADVAKETQARFPNLVIVSDPDQALAKAMQVIHHGAAADGSDTNAPTTFLVDGSGYVRWRFRPDTFFERLPPQELLTAIDQTWSEK
jgi:peroxiredoxin